MENPRNSEAVDVQREGGKSVARNATNFGQLASASSARRLVMTSEIVRGCTPRDALWYTLQRSKQHVGNVYRI